MRSDAEDWRPGDEVGGVTIVRRIAEGQGSSGVVHLVDTPEGERLILKSLRSDRRLDRGWIDNFRREMTLHLHLSSHRHIVTFRRRIEAFGSPHLLMEYCELGTLHHYIASAAADTDLGVVASLLADVCSAVSAVHQLGFVFGDLNPLNVLLEGPQRGPRAKLTDFGMATLTFPQRMPGDETPDPDTLGEKHSIAPEAYRGKRQASNDIYAIGILGYGLAARDMPYSVDGDGLSQDEIRARFMELHLTAKVPDPRLMRSDLSADFTELLMSCMAKRPEDRPANAEEIRNTLLSFTPG